MRQGIRFVREIVFSLIVVALFGGFSTGPIGAQEKTEPPIALRKDKDAETFAKVKFTRLAEEAFRALVAESDPNLSEADRLLRQVQSGDWVAVRGFLKLFEPEAGRRIHSKICSDLVYANPKSTILPQDVVALADASPVELDDKQINLLSGLLRLAIRDSESRTELLALLHKGTERLGGAEVSRKRMAARMLAGADLWIDARSSVEGTVR